MAEEYSEDDDDFEITLPISQDDFDRLEALQQAAGLTNLSDFFNEALELLEWAIEQQGQGLKIGAAKEARFLQDMPELRVIGTTKRER